MISTPTDRPVVADLRRRLQERLCSECPGLLGSFPIEAYVDGLDRAPAFAGYRHVPAPIAKCCRAIAARAGASALGQYHKLLLLTLMDGFEERVAAKGIPESVRELVVAEFRKIAAAMETRSDDYYLHSNDFFAKDLAVCRLKLLPCGAKLVEVQSGVPGRLLLRSGPIQLFQGLLYFALTTHGRRPFYQMHMDVRYRREFHPTGVEKCYLRIARLLQCNPEVKGVFGTSWWYDPKLKEIDPSLSFLRSVPEQNGARCFCYGKLTEDIDDVIRYSKRRRELYEQGRYVPRWYTMVWARRDLLHWAASIAA